MTGEAGRDGVTRDTLLGGRIGLLQRRGGHRAGTDAVLLAQWAPCRDGDRVVDLGAATGAVGLIVALRAPRARLVFVERDPILAGLCRDNVAENGLADRAGVVEGDVFDVASDLEPSGPADLVVTNPPYSEEGARASPDPGRAAAHVMSGGTLAGWIDDAARRLRHRGRLALIHRADALPACLAALAPDFGSIDILPVQSRSGESARRIVIRAVKGGRAPLILRPPLVLHQDDGRPTDASVELHSTPRPADAPIPGRAGADQF